MAPWRTVNESKPPNWYLDPLTAAQKRDVHLEWIGRNVPPESRIQTTLKTDLFEEAYGGDELLFSLPFDAGIKIGFDVSAATVARARDRARDRGCRFINADVRRLPLADQCVDVVLSNSTLDHFHTQIEIEESIHELARVLKPGGILLVTLDNPRNLLFMLLRAAVPWMGLPFRLGKTLPLSKLRRILDREGLELQSTDSLIHNPRFLSTLLFLMLRRLLGVRADPPIRWLLKAFSKFEKLPTQSLTGVFIAACARKSANVGVSVHERPKSAVAVAGRNGSDY
jgi:SAM-dependent methyltransferase